MKMASVGDLATTVRNARHSAALKQTMTRLSQELTTGIKAKPTATTAGDFAPIAGLDRALTTLQGYRTATNETALMLSAMQIALGRIQDDAGRLSTGLLAAGNSATAPMIRIAAADAFQGFESSVSALNTRVGAKTLFAGRASDGNALADSGAMLADIQMAVATETTAAGVIAVVDTWFDDPGGGFATTGYIGSANSMSPVLVADGQSVEITPKADDPALRDTLKAMVLGALVSEGQFAGDLTAQAELLHEAGTRMLQADTALAGVRADIGLAEGRVDTAAAQNEAEAAALELARTDLLAVDPYKVATELEATQQKLETLYTLTARLSRMTLADYL